MSDGDTQAVNVAEDGLQEVLPGVGTVAVGTAAVGETLSHLGESRNRQAEVRTDSLAQPTLELTDVRGLRLKQSTACVDACNPDTSLSDSSLKEQEPPATRG